MNRNGQDRFPLPLATGQFNGKDNRITVGDGRIAGDIDSPVNHHAIPRSDCPGAEGSIVDRDQGMVNGNCALDIFNGRAAEVV